MRNIHTRFQTHKQKCLIYYKNFFYGGGLFVECTQGSVWHFKFFSTDHLAARKPKERRSHRFSRDSLLLLVLFPLLARCLTPNSRQRGSHRDVLYIHLQSFRKWRKACWGCQRDVGMTRWFCISFNQWKFNRLSCFPGGLGLGVQMSLTTCWKTFWLFII